MITISDPAAEELKAYFADKEKETIRIYLAHGGCSGPRLALALDAASDEDESFTQGDFTFCMDKTLATTLGDVSIDLTPMGFALESSNPLPAGEGGCGSGGGGGCSCSGGCSH